MLLITIIVAAAMAAVIWALAHINFKINKKGELDTRLTPEIISGKLNIFAAVILFVLLLFFEKNSITTALALVNGGTATVWTQISAIILAVIISAAYSVLVSWIAKQIMQSRKNAIENAIEAIRDRTRNRYDKEYGDEIAVKNDLLEFEQDRYGNKKMVANIETIRMLESITPIKK